MLTDASMTQAGVSAKAIALLEKQGVSTSEEVEALGPSEWAHQYASGLTIRNQRALTTMADAGHKQPMPMSTPANLKFGLYAPLIGLVFAAPSVLIGSINEFGPFGPERALTYEESFTHVILPGCLHLIASVPVLAVEKYRTRDSARSDTISLRDAMCGNLTNMAVVAALLLTVIIVDKPLDEANALLSRWYEIFLFAAMVPCFTSVVHVQASMLLLYIEPLDEAASIQFIGTFVDYFGEPSFAVIFGIANFIPAMSLWLFGSYSYARYVQASPIPRMERVCCTGPPHARSPSNNPHPRPLRSRACTAKFEHCQELVQCAAAGDHRA
ncbi:hypothetical protein T492DRAFT_845012 [Pavlovales sp. CCMP2436]|nr:hypothetical protein T492DRAFT_845012 [Pavlovales sp. CCMP2436]